MLNNLKQKVPIRDLFDIYLGETAKKMQLANSNSNVRIITLADVPTFQYSFIDIESLSYAEVANPQGLTRLTNDDYIIKFQNGIQGYSLAFSSNALKMISDDIVIADDSFLILRPKTVWKTLLNNHIFYFHYLLDNLTKKIREKSNTYRSAAESNYLNDVFINLEFSENFEEDIIKITASYLGLLNRAKELKKMQQEFDLLCGNLFGKNLVEINEIKIATQKMVPTSPNELDTFKTKKESRYKKYQLTLKNGQKISLKNWARQNKHHFDPKRYDFKSSDSFHTPTTQEIERVLIALGYTKDEEIVDDFITYQNKNY